MSECDTKIIRLLPWPDPRYRENPYQRLMYQALETHGIKVVNPPLMFRRIPAKSNIDWVHMHWPGWLTRSKNRADLKRKQAHVIRIIDKTKRRGVKFLWTMHNAIPHDSPFAEEEISFQRELVSRCDLIHIHFPAAEKKLRENLDYQGPVVCMPHGCYGDYYGNPINKNEARRKLGMSDFSGKVILNFGLIRPYKNVELAIESFKNLEADNVVLLLCGKIENKEYQKKIKQLIGNHPQIKLFARSFKDNEISTVLSAADIFILPTYPIFTSGSAVLALDYGLPLIATDENHMELYRDQPFFFKFDGKSDLSLQHAMQDAIDRCDSELSEKVKDFIKNHSWDQLIKTLANGLAF